MKNGAQCVYRSKREARSKCAKQVRTDSDARRGTEFTSQLYFDDALTDQVHRQPAYADNGQRATRNSNDRIYRRGGEELLLQLSRAGEGYAGVFELGLVAG